MFTTFTHKCVMQISGSETLCKTSVTWVWFLMPEPEACCHVLFPEALQAAFNNPERAVEFLTGGERVEGSAGAPRLRPGCASLRRMAYRRASKHAVSCLSNTFDSAVVSWEGCVSKASVCKLGSFPVMLGGSQALSLLGSLKFEEDPKPC